jgi:hypothetical protein
MQSNGLRISAVLTCMVLLWLSGCATSKNGYENATRQVPLAIGEADMDVGKVHLNDLQIPASNRVGTGNILAYSPVEFRTEKELFSLEAMKLPLGRYVVLRHSAEGITAGLQAGEARTFDIHYDARYPTLAAARKDFPDIAEGRISQVSIDDKPIFIVEQWRMRLTMLFSRDRQAYRVMLDQIEYTAPTTPPAAAAEAPAATRTRVPVVVAFSYRHPDSHAGSMVQQNVLFEFNVTTDAGSHLGKPQVSGWVPLHNTPDGMPYTVGVVVAEVHTASATGYKQLLDFVKSLRGLI